MPAKGAGSVKDDNVIMSCDFIDRLLSRYFEKLGRAIGHYPTYFIIIPVFLAIICSTGFQQIKYQDDPEYLFSPTDGRSKDEKRIIDTLFPMNYTDNFNPGRITTKGRFGRILVLAKDGGTVLRSSIFSEIVKLDSLIQNMTFEYDGDTYRYDQICARLNGRCFSNDILDFADQMQDIEEDRFFLKYPLWINRDLAKAYYFPTNLGGVKTDENGLIESAQAASLMYFLDISAKHGEAKAAVWEEAFLQYVDTLPTNNVKIAKFVSVSLKDELEANTHSLYPFFSITTIIMVVFSVGTCMMTDWVRSKPWLGALGCLSAGLGVAASFGICIYCGVEMIGINLAAPFLMLGVGMDDAFVLLAAWRQTDRRLSVPDRLGKTYAEAAVSISITSVTNFLSFVIGTVTPFPSVRIFCIYTAVSVLVTYVFHVCFFGACMAFFGHAEEKNLHGLTCVPIMPKSVAQKQGRSWLYMTFCTGGRDPKDPNNPLDNQEHSFMVFFRDILAEALNKGSVKFLVILVFVIYLVFGIYGCTLVKEGLDRRKLSRDDSYSVVYYDLEDRFFREYPYRVQLVINQTLNYADPKVQDKIERMLTRFESSPYIAQSNLTESWLRAYKTFINHEDSFIFLQSLNLTDQDDFYTGLKSVFLYLPMTEGFRNDIKWNEDQTEIVSSRFVIQTKNIRNALMEKEMLLELRAIADEFKDDHLTIFNHLFIFFDQFILVREISLQTIGVAAIVMMAISIFFIPSVSCAIWVAFSIISIEIGVVGYMTHWGVNLDSISMINLIMCIGFSVDFSAHISYAYISCGAPTPAERVKTALYSLGLPIFQGSVSTILGIIALAAAPSYVFVTFFKTVFLVMLFGATHGVLLLPVLLSVTDGCFGSSRSSVKSSNSDSSISDSSDKKSSPSFHRDTFSVLGKKKQYRLPDMSQIEEAPIGYRLPLSDKMNYHVNPGYQHDNQIERYHSYNHHHHHQIPIHNDEIAVVTITSGQMKNSPHTPIFIPRVALNDTTSVAVMPSSASSSASNLSSKKYSSNWIGVHEADSGQETKTSSSSSSSLEGIDVGNGASGEEYSESSDKGLFQQIRTDQSEPRAQPNQQSHQSLTDAHTHAHSRPSKRSASGDHRRRRR